VQVELKSQRRTWEKEDRKVLIKFHGCVYSLCVVGIMPLHICFLLHASFICCVCDFMEELKSECRVNEFELFSLSEPENSCKGAVEFVRRKAWLQGCVEKYFILISGVQGKASE
jgi:hypothetical protein